MQRYGMSEHNLLNLHLCCSLMYEFMLLGVILLRKSTYSSEWNCVISRFVAGFARYDTEKCQPRTSGVLHTYEDFHLFVESIVHDEGVTHPYTSGLHPGSWKPFRPVFETVQRMGYSRMPRTIVEGPDIRVEEITL